MNVPKQRTHQKKLYYKPPAPFTPTKFMVIVNGVDEERRNMAIMHLADIINVPEKELMVYCQELEIHRTSEKPNYDTGSISIINLEMLLKHLGWPAKDCQKAYDLLSVKNGREDPIGEKRPGIRRKKQKSDEFEIVYEDEDDEFDLDESPPDYDGNALAMEIAAISGPGCVGRFKQANHGRDYKKLKEDHVKQHVKDICMEDIRKKADEEIEKRVRAELFEECEAKIRSHYEDTNAKALFEGVALRALQKKQEEAQNIVSPPKPTQKMNWTYFQ